MKGARLSSLDRIESKGMGCNEMGLGRIGQRMGLGRIGQRIWGADPHTGAGAPVFYE